MTELQDAHGSGQHRLVKLEIKSKELLLSRTTTCAGSITQLDPASLHGRKGHLR